MIKTTDNKNFLKFLTISALIAFIGAALFAASDAGAAPLGKKKKGYSSKNAANAARPATKKAQAKPAAGAAVKEKAKPVSKKSAKQAAKAPAASVETSVSVPAQSLKNNSAEVKPAPLKAMALSSNNYYESRYNELSQKSAANANKKKSSAAASKTPALSSNVVISSDGDESYFKAEDAKAASNNNSSKRKTSSSTVRPPRYSDGDISLARNSRTKSEADPSGKAENKSAGEKASGFFSKYLGNSETRLKWFPGLYLNLGANVLENPDTGARKMWSKIGAIPRFSYNDLSFAYDLTFYFDENNNLRKTDWDSADDFIRKIYYIYYGKPGEGLSARVEMIDDLTLGSGAIFRNYCGSLRYPLLDKKLGAVATYDTGYEDYIKLFVDDIASPGIYAASFEIMPHDHVQVGAQIVSDNKVNTGFHNENVTVGSLHVGIPLSSRYNSKFKIYEEIAKIRNFGTGMHTGVLAEMADFTFKTEFRVMGSNYIPNYFDTLYEMERHYKGRSLMRMRDNGERYSGWFNEFKAKFNDAYTFRVSYEKDYSPFLRPHLSLGIDYTGLDYNKLKLSANYDRKNLYYSNSRVSDAIYGLKARYDISDSSSMCYELRHILNESGKAVDSINIETQLKF